MSANVRMVGVASALALLAVLPGALATCSAGTYNSATGSPPCASCPLGTYASSVGAKSCTQCPSGYYSDQLGASSCKAAQAGWYAPGPGAITQLICPTGWYSSSSGSGSCTICPAGSYCNGVGRTSPQSCEPGRFSAVAGATQDCALCPVGTFNNVYGSTGCCLCCSGWYNDQLGQTHCFNCPNVLGFSQGWSVPGSVSKLQCVSLPGAKSTCSQDSSTGVCPSTTGSSSSSPSAAAHKRDVQPGRCARGQKSCPVYARGALSGYECTSTDRSLEQCGGCVAVGESALGARSADGGRDCTAIPQAEEVSCYKGACRIKQCKRGYVVSADGERCEAPAGFKVQEILPRVDRRHVRRPHEL